MRTVRRDNLTLMEVYDLIYPGVWHRIEVRVGLPHSESGHTEMLCNPLNFKEATPIRVNIVQRINTSRDIESYL